MNNEVTAFTVTVFPDGVSTEPGWRFKQGILMTENGCHGESVIFNVRTMLRKTEVKTDARFDSGRQVCVNGSIMNHVSIALMFKGEIFVSPRLVENGHVQSLIRNTVTDYSVAMIDLPKDTAFKFTVLQNGNLREFCLLYDSKNEDISLKENHRGKGKKAQRPRNPFAIVSRIFRWLGGAIQKVA